MDEYRDFDMTGLAQLVALGEATPEGLLDAALERMAAVNDDLAAVVLTFEDVARRKIAEGLPEGPFRGVPFLLKDLGAEAVDYPSHNGSRLFANTSYTLDSSIYQRIAATGVVVFGRTAAPEGGIGPVTEAAVYGAPTRNPYDRRRTPGGSSGGAGAAVAAGIVPGAHGSDGGGSVRIPASNCGLFGFKPTRARLPDGPYHGEGWAGMATDGFLTRSVRDTAVMLDACVGRDLGAPYDAPALKGTFRAALDRPPRALKIAICDTSLTGATVHPDCRAAVADAGALLTSMGHHVEPAVPLGADTAAMMRGWTDIVACGTALGIRSRLAALGRGLQPGDIEGVSRSAMAHAASVSGEQYLAAVATVHRYGRQMAAFFEGYDMLLTPTMAEPPAHVGRFTHDRNDYVNYRTGPDGVFAYSPFTAAFNATGQPAASIPLWWSSEGLPIGVHLAARFGEDETLMALAADLERARPWFGHMPD
jgi:amidase/6-aminohexanoate-cyclic-dimer hydrolase